MKHSLTSAIGRKLWAIQSDALLAITPMAHAQLMAEQAQLAVAGDQVVALADESEVETEGKVAVITLRGVITPYGSMLMQLLGLGGGGLEGFRQAFRAALADDAVGSIVLNIDSPGGLVDQVPETATEIREARGTKPIIAVANTLAASAAYFLAAQADELVATPSGEVGSIGILVRHANFKEQLAKEGVEMTLIHSGKYKTEGNMYEPLTASARENFQGICDEFTATFHEEVAAGRGVDVEAVATGYGEGRTLLAEPALQAGMIDRIATLDATIHAQGGTLESAAPSARNGRRAEEEAPKPAAEETPPPVEAEETLEKPELSDEQRQRLAGVLLG
jgi:signal peptide peptidase SppA